MLSVNKVGDVDGEYEIRIGEKLVGYADDIGSSFEVNIASKNNPFAFYHCGVAKIFTDVEKVFIEKATGLIKHYRDVATEMKNISNDRSYCRHYVSLRILSYEVYNRQMILDDIVEFCYDEFESLLKENENHEA